MKKLVIIILLVVLWVPILGDPADSLYVNKEDVIKVYNRVKTLERSDSLKTDQISVQKQIIDKQKFLISQLKENSRIDSMRVELYKERVDLVKPSFWEKKELWFIYGMALVAGSSWIVYNIK